MKLDELLKHVAHVAVRGPRERAITGIAYDSRQVRKGYLFVAVPGEHQDGVAYVDDALTRGAVAVLCQHADLTRRDAAFVQVADARQALAEAAGGFYGRPADSLRMVGVTGTNGKTTISLMVRDLLAAARWTPGLIGTVQYEVGARVIPASRTTPEAPDIQALLSQMLQVGCRSATMEVSSHALVQKRVWGIDFDVAVFTNLTRDHLDYHKTMDQYFAAKSLLFDGLGRGRKAATAVINIDDPWGRRLTALPEMKAAVLTYGCGPQAMVRASEVHSSNEGSRFTVSTPWGERRMTLALMGHFNVLNALAATAAGGALGLDLDLIVNTLARVVSVPGRLEPVPTRRGFQVFVDYAHTDDALTNVLQTLGAIKTGRLIVVFGCGGNRDRSKRPLMGAAAARLADFVFLTSDNPRKEDPRQIIEEIRAGFGERTNYEIVEDRAQAIRRALDMALEKDIVLIAGKGHENYQEFANTIVPFDDRQVVRNLLKP